MTYGTIPKSGTLSLNVRDFRQIESEPTGSDEYGRTVLFYRVRTVPLLVSTRDRVTGL